MQNKETNVREAGGPDAIKPVVLKKLSTCHSNYFPNIPGPISLFIQWSNFGSLHETHR